MLSQQDYEDAIKYNALRQNFIDRIDRGGTAEFVFSVNYCSNGLFWRHSRKIMTTKSHWKEYYFGKPGYKSRLSVYPGSFNINFHPSFVDFCSTLIFHEGSHARDNFYRNFGVFNSRPHAMDIEGSVAFELFSELRAIDNQIRNFNCDNSESFKSRVERDRKRIVRELVTLGW